MSSPDTWSRCGDGHVQRTSTMKRLHVIGGKNHGKTTLIVELVRELARHGVPVGTIKPKAEILDDLQIRRRISEFSNPCVRTHVSLIHGVRVRFPPSSPVQRQLMHDGIGESHLSSQPSSILSQSRFPEQSRNHARVLEAICQSETR